LSNVVHKSIIQDDAIIGIDMSAIFKDGP